MILEVKTKTEAELLLSDSSSPCWDLLLPHRANVDKTIRPTFSSVFYCLSGSTSRTKPKTTTSQLTDEACYILSATEVQCLQCLQTKYHVKA